MANVHNISIACANFELLGAIQPHQKLFVNDSGELFMDERWLQGVRRTFDGSSRNDIEIPIAHTFAIIVAHKLYSETRISSVLETMSIWADETYGDSMKEWINGLKSAVQYKDDREIRACEIFEPLPLDQQLMIIETPNVVEVTAKTTQSEQTLIQPPIIIEDDEHCEQRSFLSICCFGNCFKRI